MDKSTQAIEPVSLEEDNVKVELSWIGEGWNGDYQADDPNDEPLLRFDISAHKSLNNPYAEPDNGDGWEPILDASYCTQLLACDKPIAIKALRHIMDVVKPEVLRGYSIKKVCERLSWISDSDLIESGV
jgi:hypothetical protein